RLGEKTRTSVKRRRGRTWRRWAAAIFPAPITASEEASAGARRSTARAVVAAVRSVVSASESHSRSGSPVSVETSNVHAVTGESRHGRYGDTLTPSTPRLSTAAVYTIAS